MEYPEIRKACLYGVGIIGAGWAANLTTHGIAVNMYNPRPVSLERAKSKVTSNFDMMVIGGLLTAAEAEAAMALITYTTDPGDALRDVQLIQESVSEGYDAKKEVLEVVDKYCGAGIIFATSTSSLLISQIASYSLFPDRCICIHPYNPPHLIPLVELVGPGDSDAAKDAVEHARKFMLSIGKKPVVLKKETKGFIANRFQVVVGREIVELVKRGVCSVEDCETALTFGPGLRWAIMGHNLIMQLGGGENGVRGMFEKVVAKGSDRSSYLDDLGNWIKYPDDWPEVVQAGIDEALANRPRERGNDNETLAAYRDKMLMEILKLHQDVKL